MRSHLGVLAGLSLALGAFAGPARAQQAPGNRSGSQPAAQSRPRPGAQPKADKPAAGQAAPLSTEDAELVKELALLERVDLLRNLELFEGADADPSQPPKPVERRP